MSKNEYRNLIAKCIDKESIDEIVLHEVEFDRLEEDGVWTSHVVRIMAKDPIDAINVIWDL